MLADKRTKKVFLTGGTAGIGKATTLLLAQMGFELYIIGRDRDKMDILLQDAGDLGVSNRIISIIEDLNDKQNIKNILPEIWREHGPFDVLINNAGIGFGSVVGASIEDLNYMINTNLLSYMQLAAFFAERMKEEGIEGDIINIGSMSADSRDADSSGYVASKAGIQGFTEAFRKEVNPHNIRVTLIEPGLVNSDMQAHDAQEKKQLQEKDEMLEANDIANLIVYILQQDRRVTIVEIKIKPLRQII